MENRDDFDYLLEFAGDVVRDIQARVINSCLLTHLAITSPISRVITQTIPPFQMKAHWASPELEFVDGTVRLSVEVAGGVRHAVEGINLTMEGTVGALCRPEILVGSAGQPGAALTCPSALELDLTGVRLSYAGDDAPLSWQGEVIGRAQLATTLSLLLMAPLARLPLVYVPASMPLRLPGDKGDLATPLPPRVATASVSVDAEADQLRVAMRCQGATDFRSAAGAGNADTADTADSTGNAAVALSEIGLRTVFDWLCRHGRAAGVSAGPHGPVPWRWESITPTVEAKTLLLDGRLRAGSELIAVGVEVSCSLAPSGWPMVRAESPGPHHENINVILDAFAGLLCRILFTPGVPPGGSAAPPQHKPTQLFLVSGPDIAVAAPAVDLSIQDGHLVARYDIPLDDQPLTVTLEGHDPRPRISQHLVPRQTAPGAPVTVTLHATVDNPHEPPYDFAWRPDGQPRALPYHGPTITVTTTPPVRTDPAVSGPRKLTTVRLKAIDILGRAGETEFDATYYPATAPQPEASPGRTEPPPKPAPAAAGGGSSGRLDKFIKGTGMLIMAIVLLAWHPWDTTPATDDVFAIPLVVGGESMRLQVFNGRVCQLRDIQGPYSNEFLVPGTGVQNTFTVRFDKSTSCSGTYVRYNDRNRPLSYRGSFSYTQTMVSNRANVFGGPAQGVCTAGSYAYIYVTGSVTNRNVVARYSYRVPTWSCPRVMVAVKYALDNGAAPVTNGVWFGKIETAR